MRLGGYHPLCKLPAMDEGAGESLYFWRAWMIKKLTNELVDLRLYGRKIKRLEDISGSKNKILWECLVPKCNHKWLAIVSSVLSGSGCRKCAGKLPLTNRVVDARLKGKDIQRIGEVIGSKSKITWICLKHKCGHEWDAKLSSVLQGSGCRKCNNHSFDSSKPSVVYVYKISDEYCGYGISNNFEKRNKEHQASFRKHGVTSELRATYDCSGTEAQNLEILLKKTFEITNTGIRGFKTEATYLHNLPDVLKIIYYKYYEHN